MEQFDMRKILRAIYQTSLQDVYRYYAYHKQTGKTRSRVKEYLEHNGIRKLHVGCGGNVLESWLNTDVFPESDQICMLNASRQFPIPSESFDYVYSEHLFEHLTFSG